MQGQGPYGKELKKIEGELSDIQKRINEKMGIKESDTGLAPPNLWDVAADKQRMSEEQPLQVWLFRPGVRKVSLGAITGCSLHENNQGRE